jgi:type I restriction enzyme S subunit
MEVKRGYKQTEVGAIPEDWGIVSLSALLRQGPTNGWSGRSTSDTTGTPTLSLAATTSGRLVLNGETVKYLENRIPSRSDLFLAPGDILVQRSNTAELVGTTAVFDGPPGVFVYPDLMMRLRFKLPVTGQWFWRYANSASGRSYFRSIAAGSAGSMPKISGAKLRDMPVPLPARGEQEGIGEALSDADGLIDSLEQLLTKKRQLKQGTMQALLTGKKRLPGFETKPGYKQTEAGVIPEDWEVATLDAVCSMKSGEGITSPSIDRFSKYPCYGGNGLRGFTTRFTHNGRYALIGRVGALCGNVLSVEGMFFASEHAIVVTASPRTDSRWLTFVLGEMRLNKYSESSAQPVLSVSKLLRLEVALPSTKAEQEAIAAVLSDMNAETAALEMELAKARGLKQGMMQELLTGRIRLPCTHPTP